MFFGAFSDQRKIAYAPSFGIPGSPRRWRRSWRGYLRQFSHLSVREQQGQRIVRHITGQDVPAVLDPTLLLDRRQWAEVAEPSPMQGAISSATASAAPVRLNPTSAVWRRRQDCRWCSCAASARRSTQGPLRTGRRSGRVSGVVPGGQRGVHQLLPRDRVFHPVPKALLHRRGAGGAGIAGEFPDLQPALYPGPHGADHRQGAILPD